MPNAASATESITSRDAARVSEGVPATLIVAVIALLVVLVSLPRFRAHVVRANRIDAPTTLGLIGNAVFRGAVADSAGPDGEPTDWRRSGAVEASAPIDASAPLESIETSTSPTTLFEVVQQDRGLRHRLRDVRLSPGDAAAVSHHGYYFATGRVLGSRLDTSVSLVAWPVAFGRTGDIAYTMTSDGAVFAHANGGLWTGDERPLVDVDLSDEGWVLITAAKRR